MAKLGATGKFPDGKVHPTDEGELKFLLGQFRDQIYIEFGTPVKWLSLPLDQAETFANAILAKVSAMRKRTD